MNQAREFEPVLLMNRRFHIKKVKAAGLRWGGDFSKVDTPHFDKQLSASSLDYDMKYFFNQRIVSLNQPIRSVYL